MAHYTCRDYNATSTGTSSTARTYISSYLLVLFLRRILGYTYVGDTNYPINNFGSLLIASGDTTPTASAPTFPGGNRVGIANNGANIEVQIPLNIKTVTSFDIGRTLVIKSTRYPTRNSGIFGITSIQQGNTTTITGGSNNVSLPQGTIYVNSVSGFPTSGSFFVGASTTVASTSNAVTFGTTTTTASASNGVALPNGNVNVASTVGFPTSGTISVVTSAGTQTVTYTGTNATQFTGCTGGTGTMTTGNLVSLPASITINVISTTGFPTTGTFLLSTSAGTSTITYTGITGTSFTGCTGGTGTTFTGGTVLIGNGFQTITYGTVTNANTTIASGSNGQSLPQATINVASTTGFLASGVITVTTGAGLQTVTYSGTTGTSFTGCTGGTGAMTTGGAVTQQAFTSATGGTGTLVTGQSITNQNKYVIDYRGNGDAAIVEANDTVMWWLYERDSSAPQNGAGNGTSGYNSVGSSVTPRIILQSPHALAWQVRVCNESTADSARNIFNGAGAPISAAPGFGGNGVGDFPIGGDSLHNLNFFNLTGNVANQDYSGGNGFGDDAGNSGQVMRYTLIGDDTGQSVTMIMRRASNLTSPRSFLVTFGLPDNEPVPLPIKPIRRLYVLGNTRGDVGNGTGNDVSLQVGYTNGISPIQGITFHESPISCHPSMLAYVTSNNQGAGPMYDANGGDCPFTSSTELLPVDLTAGTVYSWNGGTPVQALAFYPKVLGQLPIIKVGRGNFAEYTLTTDNSTWSVQTTSGNGISPIQITTTAANTLITGQSVAIHSVGGNTNANGTFIITVINSTNFTLNGTTGNGAFTSGGTVLRGGQWQHLRRGIYIPWNGPAVVP